MTTEGNAPALSAEQIAAVTEIVNRTVNGAAATQKKLLADSLKKSGEDMAKLLDEKLSGFRPTPAEGGDGGEGGKKSKGDSVETATLKKQMADQAKVLEDLKRDRDTEKAKNRAAVKERNVSNALSKYGIEGMRFQGAYAMLDRQGRVKHVDDEGDDLVFVDDTGAEIELDAGLAGWVKNDVAKMFLPPSGAAGSGARRPPSAGTKPPEKKDPTFEDVGNAVLGLVAPQWGEK